MDSSVIFLVVIGLWAAYLVPHWLRRREDLSASRSVDRFSAAMRVLTRRPAPEELPERPRTSAYVLAPTKDPLALEAGSTKAPATGTTTTAASSSTATDPVEAALLEVPGPEVAEAVVPPRHAATRAPRRRLARALAGLLVLALVAVPALGGLALAGLVPGWAAAPAAGLALLLVVGLRASARRRRARASRTAVPVPAHAVTVHERSVDAAEQSTGPAASGLHRSELFDESEHTAREEQVRIRQLAEEALRAADVPYREPEPGEWTPVAVPLPAYLLKPHARPSWQPPALEQAGPARRPDVDDDDIPTYAPPSRRAAGA